MNVAARGPAGALGAARSRRCAARPLNTGGAHQWRRSVSGNRHDQGRGGRKAHLFKC